MHCAEGLARYICYHIPGIIIPFATVVIDWEREIHLHFTERMDEITVLTSSVGVFHYMCI